MNDIVYNYSTKYRDIMWQKTIKNKFYLNKNFDEFIFKLFFYFNFWKNYSIAKIVRKKKTKQKILKIKNAKSKTKSKKSSINVE